MFRVCLDFSNLNSQYIPLFMADNKFQRCSKVKCAAKSDRRPGIRQINCTRQWKLRKCYGIVYSSFISFSRFVDSVASRTMCM